MIIASPDKYFPKKRNSRHVVSLTYIPLFLSFGLRLVSESTSNLSYLLLAVYALFGHAYAIRALALLWLFTMLNPGLAPDPSAASVGRFAVLLLVACGTFVQSGFLNSGAKAFRTTFWTMLLGTFLVVHSLMFSLVPDVSILKALSWTMAMASLLSAWSGLYPYERRTVANDVFLGLALVGFASLPLVVLPVGYLTNGKGFQGILNQPQAFGVTMALLGVWASARILAENIPRWWLFGLSALSMGFILLSEARTAGLALGLGLVISVVLLSIFAGHSIRPVVPGLYSKRVGLVLGIALISGAALAPRIAATITEFMTKSERAHVGGLLEAYTTSRGVLIYPMLDNISERPLTGIGFGVASKPSEMTISRDPIFGIPVGAAVEKGVAPLMVLEELGVIGLLPVTLWLLMLVHRSARAGIPTFTVCLTVLLLNLGEASLFSAGGMGLLPMILLSWAVTNGSQKYFPRSERSA